MTSATRRFEPNPASPGASPASPDTSKSVGRTIGGLYLMLALIGGPAYFLVNDALVIAGDATATLQNIISNEGMFRASVAAWLVTTLIDIVIACIFYWVFAPAAPRLALATMIFRLAYVAVHAGALTNLFDILTLLDHGVGPVTAQDVLQSAEAHLNGFMVSLLFFGVHLILLAAMIARTRAMHTVFSVLLALAGLAYIVDTFALALLPSASPMSRHIDVMVTTLASLGELGFLSWLLIAGLRTPQAAL